MNATLGYVYGIARCLLLSAGALVGHLAAQQDGLYLITGTPNNKGGYLCHCDSELYKISPPGQPVLIRRLATHEAHGLHTVLPDYDRGVIFVASPGGDYPGLEAISMKSPTKIVSRPEIAKEIPRASWVPWPTLPFKIVMPAGAPTLIAMRLVGSGPDALVQLRFGDDPGYADITYAWSEVTGTLVPRPTPATAISSVRIHGEFGFPGSGMGDSDTGLPAYTAGGWVLNNMPIELPPLIGLPSEISLWQLLARSDEATIIKLMSPDHHPAPAALRAPGVPAIRMYRASTKKWEPLEIAGSDPRIRLLGRWLLMITGEEKNGRMEPLGKAEQRQPPAGRWHDERLRRPQTIGRFKHEHAFYPGALIAMDLRTGKTWRIQTNQSDSEPLLVEGNAIYYRINDRILQADLQANGQVSQPTTLAQSDELRDAHWAFLGPR